MLEAKCARLMDCITREGTPCLVSIPIRGLSAETADRVCTLQAESADNINCWCSLHMARIWSKAGAMTPLSITKPVMTTSAAGPGCPTYACARGNVHSTSNHALSVQKWYECLAEDSRVKLHNSLGPHASGVW